MSHQRLPRQWEQELRFVICFDYGTTYSGEYADWDLVPEAN